jgi:hypothetical protein
LGRKLESSINVFKMMRFSILFFLLPLFSWLAGKQVQEDRILSNPLFAFYNSMNKQGIPFIPFEEQAIILKKNGFDGIEHQETTDILELKKVISKHGLKIYADYVKIDIDISSSKRLK